MGSKLGGTKKGIVDINITPFVDIILVVLILFMVTSTVVASERIPVDLPTASTGKSDALPRSLAVTVQEDGPWFLDGHPTDSDGLRDTIRASRAAGEELVVLVGADRSTPHGQVVGVIDLIRQEGTSRFAIEVSPGPLPNEAAQAVPLKSGAP